MITLREDQAGLIGRCRARFVDGYRSVLMVAATGFGKTICFSWLSQQSSAKGKNVLILVHRDALLDQVSRTLARFDVPHSFIAPDREFDRNKQVQVASVFCLARRIGKINWVPDLIIVDEAHHAIPGSTWNKVLGAYEGKRVLGATATPERLGGQGLIDTFQCMEVGPPMDDLIAIGALSDFILYRADMPAITATVRGGDYVRSELSKGKNTAKITGDVISHYRERANNTRALGFCVDIAHAKDTAQAFRDAGYRAASIDGDMQKWAQRKILADFESGALTVMTSCDLVSEGFDVPAIQTGIFLRDTQSIALARQMQGRVLRASDPPMRKTLLDHAGITHTHGWPNDEIEWSLQGKKGRKPTDKKNTATRLCGGCFATVRAASLTCRHCGFEFPVEPRKVKQADGELVEAKRVEKQEKAAEVVAARTLPELIAIGKQRGYQRPSWWAMQVLKGRHAR
jgi:DNA repair protein RadD